MTKEKEESAITTIRDPRIEPYFIGKDSHCYTVYETITPDVRYTLGSNNTKLHQVNF